MVKALAVLFLSMLPVCSQAGVLWLQTPSDGTTGYVNQQFSDFPTFSTYAVSDITVGAPGWQVSSISEQFGGNGNPWPSSFSVLLNIFAKTGALPVATDDPTTGTAYAATLSRVGAIDTVTITGLSVSLAPGDYWVGFTPVLTFGVSGQEYQLIATTSGDFSGFRNPGGGFGLGTNWMTSAAFGTAQDLAMEIDGTLGGAAVPEPGTISLLGSAAAALFVLRRRAVRR